MSGFSEGGVEIETVNGSKILRKRKEDVKEGQGGAKRDGKKNRDDLEGQDRGKESKVGGIGREEVLDVSRNVVLDKDIDNLKMKKSKKNKGHVERKRVIKEGEVQEIGREEDVEIEKNVFVKKAKAKKKNKKDKGKGGSDHQLIEHVVEHVSLPSCGEIQDAEIVEIEEKAEERKKKKRKREKKIDEVEASSRVGSTSQRRFDNDGVCDKDLMKKARKKHKLKDRGKQMTASDCSQLNSDGAVNEKEDHGKRKKPKLVEIGSQGTKPGKGKKKVKFSDNVEVFPISDHVTTDAGNDDDKLVRGKRFSREEDEILKKSVYDYIKAHSLGDEGVNMVLNCRSHREIRNCWKEIGLAIPYRPRRAIYHRPQNLFRRSQTTKWTKEEYEMIKEFRKEHAHQWKILADELKKHRVHVKDTWRRIRYSNLKKGHWDQEEYQGLFDLVNLDLRMKFHEEKKSKHGMLRDNICWTAISDKLSTRSDSNCCQKWYDQLTSSMVAEGEWADADDYRLINALYELDASCIEDVDWDMLLEHRPGEACRKRWNQMVLHLGYPVIR